MERVPRRRSHGGGPMEGVPWSATRLVHVDEHRLEQLLVLRLAGGAATLLHLRGVLRQQSRVLPRRQIRQHDRQAELAQRRRQGVEGGSTVLHLLGVVQLTPHGQPEVHARVGGRTARGSAAW